VLSFLKLEPEKRPLAFDTHKFVYVRKTDISLSEFGNLCKRAIAAIITGDPFKNLLFQNDETIDGYFKAKMHRINSGEILVFNDKGSLFYPDPGWERKAELDGKGSVNCMLNNYQSCLNVLFAVNSFLVVYKNYKQIGVAKERLEEFRKALSLAFLKPPDPPIKKIYFKHVYTEIASKIGLDKVIAEAMIE
jgi:hypothetical protein